MSHSSYDNSESWDFPMGIPLPSEQIMIRLGEIKMKESSIERCKEYQVIVLKK